jgi:polyhydroxyalkanoate synthesis regulator phasin
MCNDLLRWKEGSEMDPKMMQKTVMEGMLMSFDSMNSVQEQMEKMWKTLLDQSGDLQKEGEKVMSEWLENMHKGREEFRRNLEEGLRKMEDLLGQE